MSLKYRVQQQKGQVDSRIQDAKEVSKSHPYHPTGEGSINMGLEELARE